ncbi:MAG: hypothetical protein LUQ07_06205, partial [Methanospirillum sp.]|nr:hypothetical protein [Methanospirillum sp.]
IRNRRKYLNRRHRMLYSTDLSDEEFIYSGEKRLEERLEDAVRDGHTHIFIVQACPPAIIGDNIEGVAEKVRRKYPHVSVYPVPVQGNLTGDFSQGIIDTYRSISGLLTNAGKKTDIPSVNILAGKMFAGNDEKNFKTIQALLSQLNITVNCCCISKTSFTSLMRYGDAWLNIPTEWDASSRSLYTILSAHSGIPFLIHPLPVGFSQTARWITGIGSFFGCEERAREIISREREKYLERISVIRPHLAGKKILVATQKRSVDWILELAEDLEMDVIKVGLMYSPSNDYYYTCHSGEYPVSDDYSVAERSSDIANLKPDLVLYSYPPLRPCDQSPSHIIPYSPDYGFQSGALWAERLSRVVRLPRVEGWKTDGGILV